MDEAERIEELTLTERALAAIPGGSSTGSKRPIALFGFVDESTAGMPAHFVSAAGCELTMADGRVLTDCTMALGSVSIGYADDVVTHAVMDAVRNGNVAGMAPVMELDLAERLSEIIPVAEQVLFLKTGAEGTAAAVRLARAATGRNHVIGSGYFGWLDWCSVQPGVPESVARNFSPVPFNDVGALQQRAAAVGSDLAAIIIEPVVDVLAAEEWARTARELCDQMGAVLIFDEVKTGFRLRTGGYQELTDIRPDLAVFGKAMANGFPLSALVGRAAIMKEAERSWISSTLANESASLAAATAVLDWHARAEVCESLWTIGAEMREAVRSAVEASGIDGVQVTGIDPMWTISFDDTARQNRFVNLAIQHGVLFKRGAYNFASLSHEDEAIQNIEYACSRALVDLLEEEQSEADD